MRPDRRGGLFVQRNINVFRDMQVTTPSPVYILIYDIECSEEGSLLLATWRWRTEPVSRLPAGNAACSQFLGCLLFLEQTNSIFISKNSFCLLNFVQYDNFVSHVISTHRKHCVTFLFLFRRSQV